MMGLLEDGQSRPAERKAWRGRLPPRARRRLRCYGDNELVRTAESGVNRWKNTMLQNKNLEQPT